MAGQGSVIQIVAQHYIDDPNWTFIFKCVPNTSHFGAVAIPTPSCASEQRYPDVVSTNGHLISIVEVEHKLTQQVANDIEQRFNDMRKSLNDPHLWNAWKSQVERVHSISLPTVFIPKCTLVVLHILLPSSKKLVTQLANAGISVVHYANFVP